MPEGCRPGSAAVVFKKMVHRKNESAPGKRPTGLFLDISATILLLIGYAELRFADVKGIGSLLRFRRL